MKIFNKHAPRKKNFARGNQISLMTQDFSRDIIRRSRLWNRFSKNKSQENRMPYKQQWNYCVFSNYSFKKD